MNDEPHRPERTGPPEEESVPKAVQPTLIFVGALAILAILLIIGVVVL